LEEELMSGEILGKAGKAGKAYKDIALTALSTTIDKSYLNDLLLTLRALPLFCFPSFLSSGGCFSFLLSHWPFTKHPSSSSLSSCGTIPLPF
jgi:hypothetical protein